VVGGKVRPEVDDSDVLGLLGASGGDDEMRRTAASKMVAIAVQIM
jgi:hypothetical protein